MWLARSQGTLEYRYRQAEQRSVSEKSLDELENLPQPLVSQDKGLWCWSPGRRGQGTVGSACAFNLSVLFFLPSLRGEATVRTTGAAMVSGIILTLYCCAASAGCNISQFDHDLPRAIRGEVSNHLANFEYASDVDNVDGTFRLWNYVLNKRPDKGIAISWPKAGIGQDFFAPLPPGEPACVFQTVDEIRRDPDAPITYGTKDQTQSAAVYAYDVPKKLGSTTSGVRTSVLIDGKSVDLNVELSTYPTKEGFGFVLEHSPGVVVGIAGLPEVLTPKQLQSIQTSAKSQDAMVEKATYFEYTKEDPDKALSFLFPRTDHTQRRVSCSSRVGRQKLTSKLKQRGSKRSWRTLLSSTKRVDGPCSAPTCH